MHFITSVLFLKISRLYQVLCLKTWRTKKAGRTERTVTNQILQQSRLHKDGTLLQQIENVSRWRMEWPSKKRIKMVVEAILNIPSSALCMIQLCSDPCEQEGRESHWVWVCAAGELTPVLLLKPHLCCILRKSLIPTKQECATHSGMPHLERRENSKWQSHDSAWQEPVPLSRFCCQTIQDKTTAGRTFLKHKPVRSHFPHPPRMTVSAFPGGLSYFKLSHSLCSY